MTDRRKIEIEAQLAEAHRELKNRQAVYPTMVARKRYTQEEADNYMAIQEAIIVTLTWIAAHKPIILATKEALKQQEKAK